MVPKQVTFYLNECNSFPQFFEYLPLDNANKVLSTPEREYEEMNAMKRFSSSAEGSERLASCKHLSVLRLHHLTSFEVPSKPEVLEGQLHEWRHFATPEESESPFSSK